MNPDSFWHQTPRTYIAIMKGRQKAVHAQRENEIVLAYRIMEIDRDNQKGTMKPISKYLDAVRAAFNIPTEANIADRAAGAFTALKAKGKAVKIRERPKRGTTDGLRSGRG